MLSFIFLKPVPCSLTALRRRIEERLDSKRIALEFEYDDFDDLDDNFQ